LEQTQQGSGLDILFVMVLDFFGQDVQASRALLLGDNNGKTKLSRNPQQGLFNEKSKTNMFSVSTSFVVNNVV